MNDGRGGAFTSKSGLIQEITATNATDATNHATDSATNATDSNGRVMDEP